MPTTTRARAEAHEALSLKLMALLKQVEAGAVRRPEAEVPDEMRILAEAMLFDALVFRPRRTPHPGLPVASAALGGLALQLGQAVAVLEHFEAQHARWSAKLNAFAWQTDRGEVPVARRRPALATPAEPPADFPVMAQLRRKLAERIRQINRG